jgi:hypothetical protein
MKNDFSKRPSLFQIFTRTVSLVMFELGVGAFAVYFLRVEFGSLRDLIDNHLKFVVIVLSCFTVVTFLSQFWIQVFIMPSKFLDQNVKESNPDSQVVVENYIAEIQRRSFPAIGFCSIIGLASAYVGEWSAAAAAVAVATMFLLHVWITRYRISKGIFGSNGEEAAELIGFIIKHTDEHGRPPGSKLSTPYLRRRSAKEIIQADVAGARS